MGAETWMLVGSNGSAREILKNKPELDREATKSLVRRLFPKEKLEPLKDGSLGYTSPPDDELFAGCFPGVSILAAAELGLDRPSQLKATFLDPALGSTIYLHAMHSVVDWFGFAVWHNGKLQRSLSLAPDDGILEDIGARLTFELPFWEGRHPAIDPEDDDDMEYPFVFHPLELGEAALLEFFGYQLEGILDSTQLDPHEIPLMRFKRSKS